MLRILFLLSAMVAQVAAYEPYVPESLKVSTESPAPTGKVFDKNLYEVMYKTEEATCIKYLGNRTRAGDGTCDWGEGCDDCGQAATAQGYNYYCCLDSFCCGYKEKGPCDQVGVSCTGNACVR